MAYTDDAVLAKLSALNETQESIVSSIPARVKLSTPNVRRSLLPNG
jgi:hypothetical protein